MKCSARQHVRDHGTRTHNPIKNVDDLVEFGRKHLANPQGQLVKRRHFYKLDTPIPRPADAM